MREFFKRGKITTVLDAGAGSSSKGARAAHLWRDHRAEHTTFSINTFMENAAHTIYYNEDKFDIFQCLSSVTALEGLEKQYLSPGCVFAEETINSEIEKHNLNPSKLGIHPNIAIVTKKDVEYEKGLVDFEGNPQKNISSANLMIGSTLHGVGAARARRVLRRPDVLLAKDVPSLKAFLCNTQEEILQRLKSGQSALGEIAQGFQLSLYSQFYPKTTSRNCSVAAFLDDSMLPLVVAGPVILNFRTYPIRVNNNKYLNSKTGKILGWDEFNNTPLEDRRIITGDSGGCYPDQTEVTWDDVSKLAGKKIFEVTSLTKLPRRCFTFSKLNLIEALAHNDTGDDVYISVNFMNYVDGSVEGRNSPHDVLTTKVKDWLKYNITNPLQQEADANWVPFATNHVNRNWHREISGIFVGTWRTLDANVFLDRITLNEEQVL